MTDTNPDEQLWEILRQRLEPGYPAEDLTLLAYEIMQLIHAHYIPRTTVAEAIDELDKWTDYNKHDMGELGLFIRTQYVYNKTAELRQRLLGGKK